MLFKDNFFFNESKVLVQQKNQNDIYFGLVRHSIALRVLYKTVIRHKQLKPLENTLSTVFIQETADNGRVCNLWKVKIYQYIPFGHINSYICCN